MKKKLLQNSKDLIHAFVYGTSPSFATQVDFGMQPNLNPLKVFKALRWAYRANLTTKEELDEAIGNGPLLTEIVNRTKASGLENPNACEIKTVWDEIGEDDET